MKRYIKHVIKEKDDYKEMNGYYSNSPIVNSDTYDDMSDAEVMDTGMDDMSDYIDDDTIYDEDNMSDYDKGYSDCYEDYLAGEFDDSEIFESVKDLKEEVDVKKIIDEVIDTNWSGSNDEQLKAVQLLKGLSTSDDPKSNKFMKALDKATSSMNKDNFK